MLLAVIDLIAQGIIKTNFIEFTPDLGELFTIYWLRVMPSDQRSNIILPFYHLTSDRFWHHIPKPGMEAVLAATRQIRGVAQLQEIVLGVKQDDDLYTLLCREESRNLLRTVLIETCFAPELHAGLVEQGIINKEAFQYSQTLLEQSRHQRVQEDEGTVQYAPAVRDQAFRRVIVSMYDHRCAVCGIRMLTADCHTVVDAAHIVPWSLTRNDTVQNGMALCRLCHWTFDEGLISVSGSYSVIVSKQLSASNNIPSHMQTLSGRDITRPVEQLLWPDPDALHWHQQKIFRKSDNKSDILVHERHESTLKNRVIRLIKPSPKRYVRIFCNYQILFVFFVYFVDLNEAYRFYWSRVMPPDQRNRVKRRTLQASY